MRKFGLMIALALVSAFSIACSSTPTSAEDRAYTQRMDRIADRVGSHLAN